MKYRILILAIFIAFLIPSNYTQAQNQADYPYYEIQPGDTLGFIADLFGTTINEITDLNNIANPDLIAPGDRIRVPSFPGFKGNLAIVPTDLGEIFSLLPIKYQVDEKSLIAFNSLLSPSQIYAGSELLVLLSEESAPLSPVMITSKSTTILDIAASKNTNPQSLLLENQYASSCNLIPGNVIFSHRTEEEKSLDLFIPKLREVSVSPLPLVQGGTEIISILSDQPITINGSIGEQPLQFFSPEPGNYVALQGVHALEEPGLIDFSLMITFSDGNSQSFMQQVLVTPGAFDEDPILSVDSNTIDPKTTSQENELVLTLISKITPTKYWKTIFSSPAYYQEYNSLFGTRRRYNDDPNTYFHTGVDFAGGQTLPITSPAPGQVVFVGPLTVRGNTIFIDHGWGIFSGFFHQDQVLVQVGDIVETNQQIGTVGNTGRVNKDGDYPGVGAHLHWEIWVNGVQVNPLDWLIFEYP